MARCRIQKFKKSVFAHVSYGIGIIYRFGKARYGNFHLFFLSPLPIFVPSVYRGCITKGVIRLSHHKQNTMFKLIFKPIVWTFSKFMKLPLWGQMSILIAISLTTLVLMTASFGHKADYMITAEGEGPMFVGRGGDLSDTIHIVPGDSLRLLAGLGEMIWAETPDGRFRGVIPAGVVAVPEGLPERSLKQDHKISFRKYLRIIDDPDFSMEKLYAMTSINSVRTTADSVVVVPNYLLLDDMWNMFRVSFTFNPDGSYIASHYWPTSFRRLVSAVTSYEPMMGGSGWRAWLADHFSWLISRPEFPAVSSNWLLSGILLNMVPFLLLCILLLLLAWRRPLYYVPNWIVNLLIVGCLFFASYLWPKLMLLRGFSFLSSYPIVWVITILSAGLFLGLYRGLRCPRCKRLEYHELVSSEVIGQKFKNRKGEYVKNRTHTDTTTGYTVHTRNGVEERREKDWEEKHYNEEVETWVDRVCVEKIKELYRCRHCGHQRVKTRREESWVSRKDTGVKNRRTSDFKRF